jgi:hypothetical protein
MMFKGQVRHDPDDGTVVLEIDPADLAPRVEAMLIDGTRFNPKTELHITVIGRSTAVDMAKQGVSGDLIAGLLSRLPRSWRVRRLDSWWRIEDPDWQGPEDLPGEGRSSVVEDVQCQEGEVFFAALSREAGNAFVSPPFHVTWYVRRDLNGIALPTAATLAKLGKRIDPQ